jgi:hypothetical protein
VPFGRLGSGWNAGATLERLCRAWGEAWRQLGSGGGPEAPALAGRLLGECRTRQPRARTRSRWRGGRECNSLVAAKPGGARAGGGCQVNAACASCEPGRARVGEEEWHATVGGCEPGGARVGGSCQVNATCSTWRPRGARCGGMLSERSWREQQARGRPRWRELPGERSGCDLRTRMRSRWRGGRERIRLVAVSPGAPVVAGVVR